MVLISRQLVSLTFPEVTKTIIQCNYFSFILSSKLNIPIRYFPQLFEDQKLYYCTKKEEEEKKSQQLQTSICIVWIKQNIKKSSLFSIDQFPGTKRSFSRKPTWLQKEQVYRNRFNELYSTFIDILIINTMQLVYSLTYQKNLIPQITKYLQIKHLMWK